MQVLQRPWGALHYRCDGPADGPAVLFANALGTDLRLWDPLVPHLPPRLRLIRYDKRGHGLSDLGGATTIADHAQDAAALIDALRGPVVCVGMSIGGLIAQALAAARPDLVRALVLADTAARIGTPELWEARIAAVESEGLPRLADALMDRWFAPAFRARPELALWRNMLARTTAKGYVAACAALARADVARSTAELRCPVLAIAGAEDGATPPEVVRAMAATIPGASFRVIPGVGHLPCVEAPETFAALVVPFLEAHA
jgi:3-oxoadipate enol-lactonase